MIQDKEGLSLRMSGLDDVVEGDSVLETKLTTVHQVMYCHCRITIIVEDLLESVELLFSGMEWGIRGGIVQRHRGVVHVSISGRSLNRKNFAALCRGRSADLSRSQVEDRRGGGGDQRERAALARSGCLDKLVDRRRPRGVDNLQQKNEPHPLEKRGGVR